MNLPKGPRIQLVRGRGNKAEGKLSKRSILNFPFASQSGHMYIMVAPDPFSNLRSVSVGIGGCQIEGWRRQGTIGPRDGSVRCGRWAEKGGSGGKYTLILKKGVLSPSTHSLIFF